jgi:hypothetical protein
VLAEHELPYDGPYNGLLVLSDGNLAMKNLGHRAKDPCWWTILEPERLEPIGDPLIMDDPCMGRFSSDLTDEGEYIYFTTNGELRRMIYDAGTLTLDTSWGGSYLVEGEDQSAGWDTTIGGGSVWMMDMGSPPTWERGWATAPQRAFRFTLADPSDRDVVEAIESPNAFNPGPPLYDPERQILVHYDTIGGAVVAHKYTRSGSGGGSGSGSGSGSASASASSDRMQLLWKQPFRNSVQMIMYADTGELVVEDSPNVLRQVGSREGTRVGYLIDHPYSYVYLYLCTYILTVYLTLYLCTYITVYLTYLSINIIYPHGAAGRCSRQVQGRGGGGRRHRDR